MNEFINCKVLNQLKCYGDSLTSFKLNNSDFMELERQTAIACLAKEVAEDPSKRAVVDISHRAFLFRVKTKMCIRVKFSRLTTEEVKIVCAAVVEYATELDLYCQVLGQSDDSLEHLKKFEGDMLLDGFTDRELEILLQLITGLD